MLSDRICDIWNGMLFVCLGIAGWGSLKCWRIVQFEFYKRKGIIDKEASPPTITNASFINTKSYRQSLYWLFV